MTMPEVEPAPELAGGFEAFYGRRYQDAVRLAYVITGDAASAEDVVQDALLRVQNRFDSLDDPWPYTRAAIVNAVRSRARRGRRERARLELVAASQPSSATLAATEMLDAIDRL